MMGEVFKEISSAATVNVTSEFLFELEAMVASELGLEIDYDALREEMHARAVEERELAMAAQHALLEAAQAPQTGAVDGDEEDEGEGGAPRSVAASEVISLMDTLRARRARRGR
jgi:hypothetical protein